MNCAVITVTYNDGYKLKEWFSYYLEYKDEIYKHIIVDNGSDAEYYEEVKNLFLESDIIRQTENKGTTAAYNAGIKKALSDSEISSIMLIGNDIKLEKEGITKLNNFLFSKLDYGMVAPVVLKKDSNKIESIGCFISKSLYLVEPKIGEDVNSTDFTMGEFETVAGGMNLAKREFYEKVGLQDEKLFMYSDEVDMGLRAKKAGFIMAVTKDTLAWHQHINPKDRKIRLPFSAFLIGRNKPYLAHKHFGFLRATYVLLKQLFIFIKSFFRNLNSWSKIKFHFFFFLGTVCGFFGIMKNFKFITNNK